MHRYAVLVCMLVSAACAAPAGSSPRPDASMITPTEIAEAGTSNAYQLVQRIRPIWLQTRGPTSFTDLQQDVVVYVDGTRIGFSEELRSLLTDEIESLEFLTAARANNRFGQRHINGAILVTMKKSLPVSPDVFP